MGAWAAACSRKVLAAVAWYRFGVPPRLIDLRPVSADDRWWMPPFDEAVTYARPDWWNPNLYGTDDPWYVQVLRAGEHCCLGPLMFARQELITLVSHRTTLGH